VAALRDLHVALRLAAQLEVFDRRRDGDAKRRSRQGLAVGAMADRHAFGIHFGAERDAPAMASSVDLQFRFLGLDSAAKPPKGAAKPAGTSDPMPSCADAGRGAYGLRCATGSGVASLRSTRRMRGSAGAPPRFLPRRPKRIA